MDEGRRCCWIDASAGAAGDMLLGALLDAGASADEVNAAVGRVGVAAGEVIRIEARAVRRHGLRATQAIVAAAESPVHRPLDEVLRLAAAAALPSAAARFVEDVFLRLATAEAEVHGEPDPSAAELHEVGALDALADVVGTAAALGSLGLLEPRARFVVGEVTLGTGTARSRHGKLPVPAPAVLALLRGSGATVRSGGGDRELCTPTGAALLVALADEWAPMPPMRVDSVGVGAGTADLTERPNVLRVAIGADAAGTARPEPWRSDALLVVEATVDDLDPRLWPDVLDDLVRAGAADAWIAPVVMRKGRPGNVVTALAMAGSVDGVARQLFASSTTLGLRISPVERRALPRDEIVVEVGGVAVRVKRGFLDGEAVTLQPEFADAAEAASRLGRPVRDVLAEAAALARLGRIAEGDAGIEADAARSARSGPSGETAPPAAPAENDGGTTA